jgi:hypothetical protein
MVALSYQLVVESKSGSGVYHLEHEGDEKGYIWDGDERDSCVRFHLRLVPFMSSYTTL